jgi:hypothetical protein
MLVSIYLQLNKVTILGSASGSADGTGTLAAFNAPRGVAPGPDGCLYIADTGNNRIRRMSPFNEVTTIAGSGIPLTVDGEGLDASFYILMACQLIPRAGYSSPIEPAAGYGSFFLDPIRRFGFRNSSMWAITSLFLRIKVSLRTYLRSETYPEIRTHIFIV